MRKPGLKISKNAENHRPPKRAVQFLHWFLRPELAEEVAGDLEERFFSLLGKRSPFRTKLDYWFQVLHYLRGFAVRDNLFQIINPLFMFRHHLKLSWRLLLKNKGYSLLNISGLALGMAVAMLLTLWIKDELSYDRFHDKLDQLYVIKRHVHSGNEIRTSDAVTWNIAGELKSKYPEVEEVAILSQPLTFIFNTGKISFREEGVYATPSFMRMFSWEILQGKRADALREPGAILISETLAVKYFGSDWQEADLAVGNELKHTFSGLPAFTVAGVFKDIPEQSSLQFDFLLPMEIFEKQNDWLFNWNNSGPRIFVQTRPGADVPALSEKIKDMQNEHIEDFRSDLFLQAYADQHLYSVFKDGIQAGGRIQYVRIFSIVAIFLILIASINFMNLATARSLQRAKEIGVRKAVGAQRGLLISQFMSESFFLLVLAFVVSLGLVFSALPVFNELTGKAMSLSNLGWNTILLFVGIGLLTTILAGTYPAFYLSSFDAVKVIKGVFRQSVGTARLRKGLVIFQFVMSILLIVGALTVHRQISYIQSTNLGLDRENVIYMRMDGEFGGQFNTVKEELLRTPGIAAVSSSDASPLEIRSNTHSVQWPGKTPNTQISMNIMHVNFDFLEVMKMQLTEGRDFDRQLGSDTTNYLINETAAQAMELDDPVGRQLSFWNSSGQIVGVVKDFHMNSLYSEISPTIIQLRPNSTSRLFVRTKPGQTETAIAGLKNIYKRLNPEYPFEYQFLDDSYMATYRSEQTVGQLSYYFSFFALFIACLGLVGLAVYTGQQRLKEISIRKVLGASPTDLVILLSKEFLFLVLIAFVAATPLAYYFMADWLTKFAYHININAGVFLIAGSTALLIALLTVGFYSVKVALVNPIEAIKSE
ncbi:MAG: ABC transporter permease [Saprospiraceae bacterium]|nr:ABC transporter permease [Lewinella sp.]